MSHDRYSMASLICDESGSRERSFGWRGSSRRCVSNTGLLRASYLWAKTRGIWLSTMVRYTFLVLARKLHVATKCTTSSGPSLHSWHSSVRDLPNVCLWVCRV